MFLVVCLRMSVRNGCRAGEVKRHDNDTSNPRNCSVIFLWIVPGNLVVGIEKGAVCVAQAGSTALCIRADISSQIPQWWRNGDICRSNRLELHMGSSRLVIATQLTKQQHALAESWVSEQLSLGKHCSPVPHEKHLEKLTLFNKLTSNLQLVVGYNSRIRIKWYSSEMYRMMVGSWNTRILLEHKDSNNSECWAGTMVKELAQYDIDIAALSESRLSGEDQVKESFIWKDYSKGEKYDWCVGFVICTELTNHLELWLKALVIESCSLLYLYFLNIIRQTFMFILQLSSVLKNLSWTTGSW